MIKFYDLFGGCGGFRLGLENANQGSGQSREWPRGAECLQSGGDSADCAGDARKSDENNNQPQPPDGRPKKGGDRLTDEQGTFIHPGQQPPFRCVGYCDFDKSAVAVYNKNFNESHKPTDIRKVDANDLPDFDLLCAGFPCQSFSLAGKRRGFADTRGTLFFEIARIAEAKKPLLLLLENVKGLISHDNGKTMEIIAETLNNLGYILNLELENSKDHGVPQNRERIYILCTHIRILTNLGQEKKMTSSEKIIQEWLFQLLLNSLEEVKELQERIQKDCILGLLILKEIANGQNQKLAFSGRTQAFLSRNCASLFKEDILQSTLSQKDLESEKNQGKATILTLMEEKSYTLSTELVWQSIDILLRKIWEENYSNPKPSTTLIAIKQIIGLKTFTYSQMQQAILLATIQLRNSSKSLWKEILSDLIVIQEGMKYERVNDYAEKAIISESGCLHFFTNNQLFQRYSIIGHLRGSGGSQVFPIGESSEQASPKNEANPEVVAQSVAWRTRTKAGLPGAYEFRDDSIANQLTTVEKDSMVALQRIRTEEGKQLRKIALSEGKDFTPYAAKEIIFRSDQLMPTLTSNQSIENLIGNDLRIRRLTPTECERLQGFPDNWTLGVPTTQRYKLLGNAVTVPVITEIGKRIHDLYLLPQENT